MGTNLNFAVRRNGSVRETIVSKVILDQLFNPAIYCSNNMLEAEMADHAADTVADEPHPGPTTLCPFDAGFVFFDFDNKVVAGVQNYAPLDMFTATIAHPGRSHLHELLERDWLGVGVYDMETGELHERFPDPRPSDANAVLRWVSQVYGRSLVPPPGTRPVFGQVGVLLSFKMEPPGWRFEHYQTDQIEGLRSHLEGSGIAFTTEQILAWNAWASQSVS